MVACCAVGYTVKKADEAASVADGLLVPDDLFIGTVALVLWAICVLLNAELFIGLTHGEYEEQSVGWAWNKGKQLGFVDAEDIVKRQFLGKA